MSKVIFIDQLQCLDNWQTLADMLCSSKMTPLSAKSLVTGLDHSPYCVKCTTTL